MKYILLPDDKQRNLTFYLAMEEFVARRLDEPDAFFTWQVAPTVIYGRNQVLENEVDTDYCRRHAISIVRRKSGGGCVYADQSNVMMSYITRDEQVSLTFSRYMTLVTSMLAELGLPATSTQNNDVLVAGRKVSGNAFYRLAGHSIVHGTMLFDTDMQHMLNAITPPQAKLDAHGVKSVRQRIGLLKDFTSLSIDAFKQYAVKRLCKSELLLSEAHIQGIELLEQEYLDPAFIYGRHYGRPTPSEPSETINQTLTK